MKHFRTQLIIGTSLLALVGVSLVAQAQTVPLSFPTSRPIVLTRAQITGLSGPVVTVIHPEGKRKVDDPVIITDQTAVWLGKRQVLVKNLRLKQYVRVTGFKDGDIITADRIDILTGSAYVPPKKPAPKVLPKPKPTT